MSKSNRQREYPAAFLKSVQYKDNAKENSDLIALTQETEMTKQIVTTAQQTNIQAIEDMLDDLELDSLEAGADADLVEQDVVELEDGSADGDTVIEGEIIEPANVSDEELEASVDIEELDIELERNETYSAQESETETTDDAGKAIKAAKDSSEKPAKTASAASRAPAGPRTPRDLSALEAQHFVLEGDAATMSAGDLDKNKAAVLASMPTQKKIAEKFENLLIAIAVNKQPSVYVKQAFKLLEEKKTITSADIVGMFKGSYSQGTAQSQAGQIMTLFSTVKIADRAKNTLTLNDNSVVAAKLRAIYAAGAAA
jgi:hypothetical protein